MTKLGFVTLTPVQNLAEDDVDAARPRLEEHGAHAAALRGIAHARVEVRRVGEESCERRSRICACRLGAVSLDHHVVPVAGTLVGDLRRGDVRRRRRADGGDVIGDRGAVDGARDDDRPRRR